MQMEPVFRVNAVKNEELGNISHALPFFQVTVLQNLPAFVDSPAFG